MTSVKETKQLRFLPTFRNIPMFIFGILIDTRVLLFLAERVMEVY